MYICIFFSAQTNGVLFVGKEERVTKMATDGHEIVISVVENPRKAGAGPSEEITAGSLVSGKKRPKPLLSDITSTDKGDATLLVNGPFVASEMLRNVAKRQRRHSEDTSLVNGTGEQKDPMAWDELVRGQTKPMVTSPKLPIAINGVRLDIVPNADTNNMLKTKTNNPLSSLGNMTSTILGNHCNITNTNHGTGTSSHGNTTILSISNHGNMANTTLGNSGNITNATVSDHSNTANTTTNQTALKSPGLPTANFVPAALLPVTSQGQSSGGNAVSQSDTNTVATAKNQTPGDKPRGEQAAGVVMPYRCLWAGCGW